MIIQQDPETKGCTVSIAESIEYNVEVWSFVVNNLIGEEYTREGLEAIRAHERRRIEVYKNAYNSPLRVFEGDIVGQCTKTGMNKLQADIYKKELEKWLEGRQREALKQFKFWTLAQQEKISDENDRIERNSLDLVTGIRNPHVVSNAPVIDLSCPKDD